MIDTECEVCGFEKLTERCNLNIITNCDMDRKEVRLCGSCWYDLVNEESEERINELLSDESGESQN